jgi:hypothetical protein
VSYLQVKIRAVSADLEEQPVAMVSIVVEIPEDVWWEIEAAAASPRWDCAPEQLASLWLTQYVRRERRAKGARAAATDEWAGQEDRVVPDPEQQHDPACWCPTCRAQEVAPDPEAWATAQRLHPYAQRLAALTAARAIKQMEMVLGVLTGETTPFA